MKLGFITIELNKRAFMKLHWLLFKLFKIKRTTPCGRFKKHSFLHCALSPTEENSYLIHNEHGYEIRCKCCDGLHFKGDGHPETLNEALRISIHEYWNVCKPENTGWETPEGTIYPKAPINSSKEIYRKKRRVFHNLIATKEQFTTF